MTSGFTNGPHAYGILRLRFKYMIGSSIVRFNHWGVKMELETRVFAITVSRSHGQRTVQGIYPQKQCVEQFSLTCISLHVITDDQTLDSEILGS